MSNKILFIPIETTVRELSGKLLLAHHLLSKGYSIYIGHRGAINMFMKTAHNTVLLSKSMMESEYENFLEFIDRDNDIINLNVEGGVLYENTESHIVNSYPDKLLDLVSLVCFWGSAVKNDFIKYKGSKWNDKLIVTGEPRFDLLSRSSLKHNITTKDNAVDKQIQLEKYLLVNTSFSVANPKVGWEKFRTYCENSYDKNMFSELCGKHEFYKEIVNEFVALISNLIKHFPDQKIVIRPHPSENSNFWSDCFKNEQNVMVDNSGGVENWISRALCVIHYDCTTGIESFLMQKPTLAFVPKKDERFYAWLPAEVSNVQNSVWGILNEVYKIRTGTYEYKVSKASRDVLAEYINNLNDDASLILSEAIRFLHGTEVASTVRESSLKLRVYSLKKWLKFSVFRKESIILSKLNGLTAVNISNQLKALDSGVHIKVQKVAWQCFKISSTLHE